MSDITVASYLWPQQRTAPDGTTYWIDSSGQVFSAALHIGPEDDSLGVDDAGLWIKSAQPSEERRELIAAAERPQGRRGWQKGKPRGPRKTAQEPAQMPTVPAQVPRSIPDAVWVVWCAVDGQLEIAGAYADPVEALTALLDLPGGRVSRALVQ